MDINTDDKVHSFGTERKVLGRKAKATTAH
jgi:hypothetical protein